MSTRYVEEFFGPVALFFRVAWPLKLRPEWSLSIIRPGRRRSYHLAGSRTLATGRGLSNLGIQEFVNKKLVCVVPINAPA